VRKITSASTGVLMVAWLVLGSVAFVPAYVHRQRAIQVDRSLRQLHRIRQALEWYQTGGREAPNLEALVSARFLQPSDLQCPYRPDRKIGYLYVPRAGTGETNLQQRILLCDRPGNFRDRYAVIFAQGRGAALTAADFRGLLGDKVNADMAKLVAQDTP
jgi:type II secretory pathway pseudopilin PulG